MSNGLPTDRGAGTNKRPASDHWKISLEAKVRALLALVVVGSFMGITLIMLMYALFSKDNVSLEKYATFFLQISSVYTGIVGVVIGYYFGRSQERSETVGRTTA